MVDHFRAYLLSQIISHEVVIKVPVNKTPVDHLQGFCSKIKNPLQNIYRGGLVTVIDKWNSD